MGLPLTIPSTNAGSARPNTRPALNELKWWFFVLFPTRRRFIAFFLLPRTMVWAMIFSAPTNVSASGYIPKAVAYISSMRVIIWRIEVSEANALFSTLIWALKHFNVSFSMTLGVPFPSYTAVVQVSVSGIRNQRASLFGNMMQTFVTFSNFFSALRNPVMLRICQRLSDLGQIYNNQADPLDNCVALPNH